MPSCGLLAAQISSSAQKPLEITRYLMVQGNIPTSFSGVGNFGWSWLLSNQGQTVTLDCNVNNQVSAQGLSSACKAFNDQLKNRQNVDPNDQTNGGL